jgi:signal transduction histidine kinase
MSITGRIRAFQIVLAVAVAAIAGAALLSVRSANSYIDRVQLSRQQVDEMAELAIRANRFSEQIAEVLLIGESERADLQDSREKMRAQFDLLRGLASREGDFIQDAEHREEERLELLRLEKIRTLVRDIDRAVERVLLLKQQGQQDQAIALFRSEIENRLDAEFETLMSAAVADEREDVTEADALAKKVSGAVMTGALALLGLLLAAVVLTGFLFARSLRTPIAALAEGTLAIQNGELNHRIRYSKPDEFGLVARRFNAMADKLQRQTSELMAARDNLEREVEARTEEITRANRQLTEIDQQRVRFLGDVSHELRTPLTVLRAEAEISLRGSSKPEAAYRTALSNIAAHAASMGALVEDLMFLARSEGDDIRMDFRNISLADLLGKAVDDAKVLARDRELQLAVSCPAQSPVVRADPRRLKQALMAVLDNAARYADRHTSIEVELRSGKGGAGGGQRSQSRPRHSGGGSPARVRPVLPGFECGGEFGRQRPRPADCALDRGATRRPIELTSEPGRGTEVLFSLPAAA